MCIGSVTFRGTLETATIHTGGIINQNINTRFQYEHTVSAKYDDS